MPGMICKMMGLNQVNGAKDKVAQVAQGSQGERATPEGVVRRTKLGSAADF